MPNFLESIFAQLKRADTRVVLREIHGDKFKSVTGKELLEQIQRGRGYVRKFGLIAGDRCALLGANTIAWVAVDLALMAEGIVVVPLYSRQATAELITMMKDSEPGLLIVGEAQLGEASAGPGRKDRTACRPRKCCALLRRATRLRKAPIRGWTTNW